MAVGLRMKSRDNKLRFRTRFQRSSEIGPGGDVMVAVAEMFGLPNPLFVSLPIKQNNDRLKCCGREIQVF